MLSRESSAEPGKWRTERAPYLREVMEAFSDPFVEEVWGQWGSQLGKTEVLNNVCGFFIDQEPSPILMVQPNVEPMAKAWSLDRLAPMLRDTPRLRGKVRDPRTRDSGNTILHKVFPGGHLTVGGANSAAGLAARPIRVALFDEVDRFPPSAGSEGDPVKLGIKRTATFWNRKIGGFSTPTRKGFSRIERAMAETDQRYFEVPCPECGEYQRLIWGGKDRKEPGGLKWESGKPQTAAYECAHCAKLIDESQKQRMLERGRWVRTNPGARKVGFYLSALYSPWYRWTEIASEWLGAQTNTELLMVFVNTVLGELWEDKGEQFDATSLAGRREQYAAEVPNEVTILTGGVDVQADRLEFEVRGWGPVEESYLIAHHRIFGDPEQLDVWQRLEALRVKPYKRADGADMRIRAVGVDTGYLTHAVYRYVRPRQGQNVRAMKGVAGSGKPLVGKPAKVNRHGVRLWAIGVDTAKDVLFRRLRLQEAGPGYLHFPLPQSDGADEEYLAQFAAEKVTSRFHKGVRIREYIKIRDRNEAIDLYVLSLAGLHSLGRAITEPLNRPPKRIATDGARSPGPEIELTPDEELRQRLEKRRFEDDDDRPRGPKRGRGGRGGWVRDW